MISHYMYVNNTDHTSSRRAGMIDPTFERLFCPSTPVAAMATWTFISIDA